MGPKKYRNWNQKVHQLGHKKYLNRNQKEPQLGSIKYLNWDQKSTSIGTRKYLNWDKKVTQVEPESTSIGTIYKIFIYNFYFKVSLPFLSQELLFYLKSINNRKKIKYLF